nr:MAG TPA: DNA-directed RNA polymerase II subunit [Caudoviricetes sp.]
MPTNDERREVARRLRSVYPRTKLEGVELAAKWYEALCAAVGGKRDPWMGIIALCNRLADLIEPEPERTCHMRDTHWDDGQCTWGCICSECGAKHEHKSGKWMNYCPNCGAKVV